MPAFDILEKKGFQNLVKAIGPEVKVSGRIAIGILADANDDPDARRDEIVDKLRRPGSNRRMVRTRPARSSMGGPAQESG